MAATNMIKVLLVISLLAVSQAAVSELKILNCSCTSGTLYCTYRVMGYGSVFKTFSGGSVGYCQEVYRIIQGGIIVGFHYRCPLNGSTSGTFTIQSLGNICGVNKDFVSISSCVAGNPCSNSSG